MTTTCARTRSDTWRDRVRSVLAAATVLAGLGAGAPSSIAQDRSTATLRVTVLDPSGAVIVGAAVSVTRVDGPSPRPVASGETSALGLAVVTGLAPGRYALEATFPGFDTWRVGSVRIRRGDLAYTAVLAIAHLESTVTVDRDLQREASDRQGSGAGVTLTPDEIEALGDDPSTLQQRLLDLAGPGAVVRIDGIQGGILPPKTQIRSIRIARDQYAAEFHGAGGVSVDVSTQPGVGPIRVNTFFSARGGSLNGRSPFVSVTPPEQNLNYGVALSGALVKNKSSFALFVGRAQASEAPIQRVALPTGVVGQTLPLKAPRDAGYFDSYFDHALTPSHTLRLAYRHYRATSEDLGIGGYDEPSRGYTARNRVHQTRVQHFGPLGTRAYLRSRVFLESSGTELASATDLVALRVLDAFTRGGAQRTGGDHARLINVASDLDYVTGRHTVRTGLQIDSAWYRSDANANYLGTFTFDSLQAYLENRPSTFTQRLGDARVRFGQVQVGVYVQDDLRIGKQLTLSPGVRYELQTHVRDKTNVAPRFGVTWAPFQDGRTTIRSSAGAFYEWLAAGTYEQAVRLDGAHQQEFNLIRPSYPDPGLLGTAQPTNRYLLGGRYRAPRIIRWSAGLDENVPRLGRLSVTYSYLRGARLARGEDRNAPVDGVRPDSAFANVIEALSDAASRQHQLQFDATLNPGALAPAFEGPRIKWTRSTLIASWTLASLRNNTDGPFSIPASGRVAGEWGPASGGASEMGRELPWPGALYIAGTSTFGQDVRRRLNVAFNNQTIRNLLVSLNLFSSTAPAYTLLTGLDENRDGIFNDRPVGVGRSTRRSTGQTLVYLQVAYQFAFGSPLPPPAGVQGVGGTQGGAPARGVGRYRLQIFVRAQNLANRANYLGYSGTMTSPFFGLPTAVGAMRKIDAGFSLSL